MLAEDSATAAFRPEVAVLVTTAAHVRAWPRVGDGLERVRALAEQVCDDFLGLCERLHAHTGCEVILNNLHVGPTRPNGNLGAKLPFDANHFVQRVNLALGERAPAYVHINDVATLAAQHGTWRWFDARYWYHAKQPVSFECLSAYVRNTAHIIGALFGSACRCVVLDLVRLLESKGARAGG